MKKTFTILLLLSISVFFAFAGANQEKQSVSESLRAISLAPNITEIIYALGAEDCLVGRSDYCNYPVEVLELPSAGNVWQPNLEVIVSMEPDIVLAASLLDPTYKESIEQAGIKVVHILSEENIEGTYDLIMQVGNALNNEKEAENLCNSIKQRFNSIEEKVKDITNRKTCIYLLGWGEFGDYAATGDTFLGSLINLAGAENAAASAQYWAISRELLIDSDPDLIILPTYSYAPADIEAFRNTLPYSNLTGQIVTIDGDISDRQGVRSPEFAEFVAKTLYPELF